LALPLQLTQAPSQALSQHTPSTQNPDEHCSLLVHTLPAFSTGKQAFCEQKYPEEHSLVALHSSKHAPLAAAHTYAPHEIPDEEMHVPEPSQTLPADDVVPTQLVAPQGTPAGAAVRHTPPAAHDPSAPHPPAVAHPLSLLPSTTAPHTPDGPDAFSDASHAWHAPSQAVEQQTPSTQNPLAHSPLLSQVAPEALSGSHLLLVGLQKWVPTQSLLDAQVVAQVVPLAQPVYGAHGTGVLASRHLPWPSHTFPVSPPATQVEAPQEVPCAKSAHWPWPLQAPEVPQVAGFCSVHSLSGSVLPRISPQTPLSPWPFFAVEQARQVPVQASLQQ
jgi:hypothetical protein